MAAVIGLLNQNGYVTVPVKGLDKPLIIQWGR